MELLMKKHIHFHLHQMGVHLFNSTFLHFPSNICQTTQKQMTCGGVLRTIGLGGICVLMRAMLDLYFVTWKM